EGVPCQHGLHCSLKPPVRHYLPVHSVASNDGLKDDLIEVTPQRVGRLLTADYRLQDRACMSKSSQLRFRGCNVVLEHPMAGNPELTEFVASHPVDHGGGVEEVEQHGLFIWADRGKIHD